MKPIPIKKQYPLTDEETAFLESARLYSDEELKQIRKLIRSETDLEKAKTNFNEITRLWVDLADTILDIEKKMNELEAKEKEPKQIRMKGILNNDRKSERSTQSL